MAGLGRVLTRHSNRVSANKCLFFWETGILPDRDKAAKTAISDPMRSLQRPSEKLVTSPIRACSSKSGESLRSRRTAWRGWETRTSKHTIYQPLLSIEQRAAAAATPAFDAMSPDRSETDMPLSCTMSALPLKAEIVEHDRDVRFVPKDGVIGRRSCG